MTSKMFWTPKRSAEESGVSVYTAEDVKFVGWATLPEEEIVSVAFSEEAAPLLQTDSRADLVFTGSGDLRLFVPKARVIRCHLVPGQITYIFETRESQWKSIRDSLSPRRAERVRPDARIDVNLTTREGMAKALLLDLSETGLSLRLSPDDEFFFLHPDAVTMDFQLPGATGDPLVLVAKLRYRALDESGHVRCGFEFDSKATSNFRDQRWRIARYVWSCKDSAAAE